MMNTVLLILIILASTLAASSSSLMYSTSSALGSFIEASKVADLNITLANDPGYNSAVEDWVKQEKKVETAYTERQAQSLTESGYDARRPQELLGKCKLRAVRHS